MNWISDYFVKTFREPGNVWAMLTAITTVALAWVAYKQLSDLARTGKSDFLYKLKKDFFTPETRKLMFLIDNDFLEFESSEIPYFRIVQPQDPATRSRLEELGITGPGISPYLIDDLLLGPLEDVGILLKRDLVSLDEVYEGFDSYVQSCADSRAIRVYLEFSRTDEDNLDNDDAWDGFKYLHDELQKSGPKIRARKRKNK